MDRNERRVKRKLTKNEVQAVSEMFSVRNCQNTSQSSDVETRASCCFMPFRGPTKKRKLAKLETDFDDIKLFVSENDVVRSPPKRKLHRQRRGVGVKHRIQQTFALCCTNGHNVSLDEDDVETVEHITEWHGKRQYPSQTLAKLLSDIAEDEQSPASDVSQSSSTKVNQDPEKFWKMLHEYDVLDKRELPTSPNNVLQVYASADVPFIPNGTCAGDGNDELDFSDSEYDSDEYTTDGSENSSEESVNDNWSASTSSESLDDILTSAETEVRPKCLAAALADSGPVSSHIISGGSSEDNLTKTEPKGHMNKSENCISIPNKDVADKRIDVGALPQNTVVEQKTELSTTVDNIPPALTENNKQAKLSHKLKDESKEVKQEFLEPQPMNQNDDASFTESGTTTDENNDNSKIKETLVLIHDMIASGEMGLKRDLVREPINNKDTFEIGVVRGPGLAYDKLKYTACRVSDLFNSKHIDLCHSDDPEASLWFTIKSFTGDKLILSQEIGSKEKGNETIDVNDTKTEPKIETELTKCSNNESLGQGSEQSNNEEKTQRYELGDVPLAVKEMTKHRPGDTNKTVIQNNSSKVHNGNDTKPLSAKNKAFDNTSKSNGKPNEQSIKKKSCSEDDELVQKPSGATDKAFKLQGILKKPVSRVNNTANLTITPGLAQTDRHRNDPRLRNRRTMFVKANSGDVNPVFKGKDTVTQLESEIASSLTSRLSEASNADGTEAPNRIINTAKRRLQNDQPDTDTIAPVQSEATRPKRKSKAIYNQSNRTEIMKLQNQAYVNQLNNLTRSKSTVSKPSVQPQNTGISISEAEPNNNHSKPSQNKPINVQQSTELLKPNSGTAKCEGFTQPATAPCTIKQPQAAQTNTQLQFLDEADGGAIKADEAPPVYIETEATVDYGRCVVEPGHGERPDKKKLQAKRKEKVKTKGQANKHLKSDKDSSFVSQYEDGLDESFLDETDDMNASGITDDVPEEQEECARAPSPVVINAVDQPQIMDDREMNMVPETIRRAGDPYLDDVEQDYKVSSSYMDRKEKRKQKDDRKKEKKNRKSQTRLMLT